jgi:hypothetical protein
MSSMTNMIRTLSTPNERVVYTVAKTGESFAIPRAFAGELVARGGVPVIGVETGR